MRISHFFGGIPTADFASAVVWYERLLGRPPDSRPHEHEAVWQLTDSGLIYVVSDPARAGNGLVTLIVDDLDRCVDELTGRGIHPGPIETMPGKARKFVVTDPDGNSIAFGQPLGPERAVSPAATALARAPNPPPAPRGRTART